MGNLLFPITRALQTAKIREEIFVTPTMFNLKIGPLIRQEKNLRFYNKEFKKRSLREWMNFFRINIYRNNVTFYSGEQNLFYDIKGSRFLIHNWLVSSCIEKPINISGKIAVHIRRGDLTNLTSLICHFKFLLSGILIC